MGEQRKKARTIHVGWQKWVGVGVFIAIAAIDRALKIATDIYHVRGRYGRLIWTHLHNYGAAGGILQGQRLLLVVTGCIVIGVLVYAFWRPPARNALFWIGWGLLLGGAFGNVFDRVVYGYVIDMFQWVGQNYVFNFSDWAIRYGTLLTMLAWWGDVPWQRLLRRWTQHV